MQLTLDSFIDSGSDQELFIASYLHGHFDVAVANIDKQLEKQTLSTTPIKALQSQLSEQLNDAFDANELSEDDARQVKALVKRLFSNS
ncbi:YfcL family protein [Glaciecola sp. MH2013]|nr:YfcL family protein [Glaciecola sp. MH2013]